MNRRRFTLLGTQRTSNTAIVAFGLHVLALVMGRALNQMLGIVRNQLNQMVWTGLHALAAGHTFLLIHLRDVSGTGHVRRVKKLRSAQCIAYIHITVTDGEDLVGAVDVRDLVNETVLFRLPENFKRLFLRDIASVLLSRHHIIRDIAHRHAPSLRIVGAALLML